MQDAIKILSRYTIDDVERRVISFTSYWLEQDAAALKDLSSKIVPAAIQKTVCTFKRFERSTKTTRLVGLKCHADLAAYVNSLDKKTKGSVYEQYVKSATTQRTGSSISPELGRPDYQSDLPHSGEQGPRPGLQKSSRSRRPAYSKDPSRHLRGMEVKAIVRDGSRSKMHWTDFQEIGCLGIRDRLGF